MKNKLTIFVLIICVLLIGLIVSYKFIISHKLNYDRRYEPVVRKLEKGSEHLNQGNALLEKGLYQEAIQKYELALQERPGWDIAHDNIKVAKSRIEQINAFPGTQDDLVRSLEMALESKNFHSAEQLAKRIKDKDTRVKCLAQVSEAKQIQE